MWKAEMRSMFGFESQGLRCRMLVRAIPIALAAVLVLPDGAIAQSGEASGVSDRLKSLFKKKSTTGAAAGAPKAPAGPTGAATGAATTGAGAGAAGTGTGAAAGAAAKSPASPAAAPSSAVLPPWSGATRFVDPNNPASVNDGEGTATVPYRTIQYAMTRLQPGERLLLAPTIYREPLIFPAKPWKNASMTLVETIPGSKSQAVIKGSKVITEWTLEGARGRYSTPLDVQPQQVYLDGKPLQQIGGTLFGAKPPEIMTSDVSGLHLSQGGIWPTRVNGDRNAMTAKSFYYDFPGKRLYLDCDCDSIEGRLVEASAIKNPMYGDTLENVTVRNIAFQHSNLASFSRGGAINISGKNVTLDNLDVSYMDTVAIILGGVGVTLSNSRVSYSGSVGVAGRGTGFKIVRNRLFKNNLRGFNKWWEAGGIKFVGGGGITNSEISGNTVIGSTADGIWLDTGNPGNIIRDNLVIGNTGMGIHIEASYHNIVFGNVAIGNGQRGIYVVDGSNNTVAHNQVIGNGLEGIAVVDTGRTNDATYDYRPVGNYVCGNLVAWNNHSIVLPFDTRDNRSDFNIVVGAWPEYAFDLGWWPSSARELGMNTWKSRTNQDKNSKLVMIPKNSALIQDIVNSPESADLAGIEAAVTGSAGNMNRMPCSVYK